MPAAVALFLEAGTGSPIKIVTGENAVLLEQLRSGDLDIVIGRLAAPEQMTSLSFEPLYRETVVFAVRTGHPLRAARTFSLPEIEGYPILMPTRGSIIRPFVERFLLNNGISNLRTEIETVSDSFGRAFLQTSDAVWIISRGVIENDIAAGTVAVLPLDTSETIGSVGFSTRAADEPGPAAMVFMSSVRETVRRAGKV
jgi:LysR family pca operon transcriptional activator